MGLKDLIKAAAGTVARLALVEVRKDSREIVLKEPLVRHFIMRGLRQRGISGVKAVRLSTRGVEVEHELFGTVGVMPREAIFNEAETAFLFDVELLVDKQKDALVSELGASAVSGVVGGLFAVLTGGLVGIDMVAGGIERATTATASYAVAPRLGCLGQGQRLTYASIVVMDSAGTTAADMLRSHGGEIRLAISPGQGSLTVKGGSLDLEVLKSIGGRMLAQSKDVPATSEVGS